MRNIIILFSTLVWNLSFAQMNENALSKVPSREQERDSIQKGKDEIRRIRDSIELKYYSHFNYTVTPWGASFVSDSLLTDITEITIGEWLNYIFYSNTSKNAILTTARQLSTFDEKQILSREIDSLLLPSNEFISNSPCKEVFVKCRDCKLLRYRALDGFACIPIEKKLIKNKRKRDKIIRNFGFPIAGITYKQAIDFCRWRTVLDSLRYTPDSLNSYIPSPVFRSVYRLPTPEEFEKMNPQYDSIRRSKSFSASFNYRNATYSLRKSEKEMNALCGKTSMSCYIDYLSNKQRRISIRNRFWVCNLQGNVAEMTSVYGVAKGGSYFHYAKDSYNGISNAYSKPELWLGFRCVSVRKFAH